MYITSKHDKRTGISYTEKEAINGKTYIIIDSDEYNDLATKYKTLNKKLDRYERTHRMASDITRLLLVIRLIIAAVLGLTLPMMFANPSRTFITIYAMLFMVLFLSLFIPEEDNADKELRNLPW